MDFFDTRNYCASKIDILFMIIDISFFTHVLERKQEWLLVAGGQQWMSRQPTLVKWSRFMLKHFTLQIKYVVELG